MSDKKPAPELHELTSELGLIEMAVYEQECLRIVFRAPASTKCKPYIWERSLNNSATVQSLIDRIEACTDVPFVIVDGHGSIQHLKRKRLAVVCMSYPV
jgi:hypothetical protein